nr:immunoglobulin heavy chain junction region [Macaca mulatta]
CAKLRAAAGTWNYVFDSW